MTRKVELEAVRREGKRIRTRHIEVRVSASLLSYPRVGFIVPKYKQNIVARNVVKRRLRELARLELLPALAPVDVVIRALPVAYDASFDTLRDDVRRVARQHARVTAG